VLVGGLALTYFLIMGGKDEPAKVPPTADGPLVMPTAPDAIVVKADIPSPEPPPTLSEHYKTPTPPSHLEVADRTDKPAPAPPPPMNDTRPPFDARGRETSGSYPKPEPTTAPRDDRFVSHGRIGPETEPRYPDTGYPKLMPPSPPPAARAADRRAYPDTPYPALPR
jgi:hypothetical protein